MAVLMGFQLVALFENDVARLLVVVAESWQLFSACDLLRMRFVSIMNSWTLTLLLLSSLGHYKLAQILHLLDLLGLVDSYRMLWLWPFVLSVQRVQRCGIVV